MQMPKEKSWNKNKVLQQSNTEVSTAFSVKVNVRLSLLKSEKKK
jgi:hypothetical protein